jgi:hypothetical protein
MYHFIDNHLVLCCALSQMIDYKRVGLIIDFHFDHIKGGPSALYKCYIYVYTAEGRQYYCTDNYQ